jgi:HEPN domain-containing protein
MNASLPDEPTPAQLWFALAEQDIAAARILINEGTTALRIAGFLAQQSAEKALKAGLFSLGMSAPRIHGLNQLLDRYTAGSAPDVDRDDLDLLDPWVIDGRYAADLPDLGSGEANDLVAAADRVLMAVGAACPAATRP